MGVPNFWETRLAEFGMTPSSRARVTVTKPDDVSPYAKLVKRT
jgi:hypothetical protein